MNTCSMEFFDTHCHLSFPAYAADFADVMRRAREKGVTRVMIPAVSAESAELGKVTAEKAEGVYFAVGHHPSDAGKWKEEDREVLRKLAGHEKCRAIGECGLDSVHFDAVLEVQEPVLRAQLELAQELKLPVILHTRGAEGRVADIVAEYPGLTGVAHCYTGDQETAERFIALGFMIGVTGIATFPSSKALRETLGALPLTSLVIETDGPFLSPQPYRGKQNEPAYVAEVAEELARLYGVTLEEVARVTTENGRRLYGLV